jgi:hypothetical protein
MFHLPVSPTRKVVSSSRQCKRDLPARYVGVAANCRFRPTPNSWRYLPNSSEAAGSGGIVEWLGVKWLWRQRVEASAQRIFGGIRHRDRHVFASGTNRWEGDRRAARVTQSHLGR